MKRSSLKELRDSFYGQGEYSSCYLCRRLPHSETEAGWGTGKMDKKERIFCPECVTNLTSRTCTDCGQKYHTHQNKSCPRCNQ
jgi:hypothetical protein